MRVRAQTFWLPKGGNLPEEYEDAAWPAEPVEREGRRFRFAVADGATETSFSGLWASLLVHAYCQGRLGAAGSLAELQGEWRAKACARPLPWYAEEKVRDGAFSSLLGISLRSDGTDMRWSALAVGDSCLFQRREDSLRAAFPLDSPDAFTSRPHLISSTPSSNARLAESTVRRSGALATNDCLYLATDALACWLLKDRCGFHMLDEAIGVGPAAFEELVEGLRARGSMRNDDVTVTRVEIL